jgi:glycerophosphoryl diester phosphodiesterase
MKYVNYAHRGASSYAPENTLMAFYKGLELGANGIETDIQLSADGVPVLFHDDTLDRVTDRTGPLAELTAAELQAVQVFCPDFPEKKDTICTFEEFLRHFGWRDLTFAIELKVEGVAEEVADLIRKYGIEEKAIVTSFKFDYIKAQSPDQFRKNNHFSQVFIVFCPAI